MQLSLESTSEGAVERNRGDLKARDRCGGAPARSQSRNDKWIICQERELKDRNKLGPVLGMKTTMGTGEVPGMM